VLPRAVSGMVVLLAALLGGAPHAAAKLTTQDCLDCHDETPTPEERAKPVSLFVNGDAFHASVHGALGCTSCHSDVHDYPHDPAPRAVACDACHNGSAGQFAQSIHAAKWDVQKLGYPACLECHGNPHGILSKDDSRSPSYPLNLPRTCGRCHGDPALAKRYGIRDVYALYIDSIHGFALSKQGLLVAASCVSCHGAHRVLAPDDPRSRTYRTHVPATCGSCHAGIETRYAAGVHGKALADGNPAAPVCTDCHTVHSITAVEKAAWQTTTVATCGNCHEQRMRSYRDTFHGQVTALGVVATARCWSCHESHEILPAGDPKSSLAPQNLISTCGQCHRGVTASFVSFDPHPDPRNRARNPTLHDAWLFMNLLLLSVFAFFGLHTLLWMLRSWLERLRSSHPSQSDRGGDADDE
jgi:hypothetical protein